MREALQFFVPGFHWAHAWKIVALVRLERWEDVKTELSNLYEANPNFGENYYIEARKWGCSVDLIETVAESLRAAGLRIG